MPEPKECEHEFEENLNSDITENADDNRLYLECHKCGFITDSPLEALEQGRLLGLQEAVEILENLQPCGYAEVEGCYSECFENNEWKKDKCEHGNCCIERFKSAMKEKTKKQELYPPDDEYVGAENEGSEPK